MATLQRRSKRSLRKQRRNKPTEANGNAAFVRLAGLKLRKIKPQKIIGDITRDDLALLKLQHDLCVANGIISKDADYKDFPHFTETIQKTFTGFIEPYDLTGIHRLGEQEVFVTAQRLEFNDTMCAYALDEIKATGDKRQAILSCLSCLVRMGFLTLKQTPGYDYFMQAAHNGGYGAGITKSRHKIIENLFEEFGQYENMADEDERKSIEARADEIIMWQSFKGFDLKYDEAAMVKYGQSRSALGEWCRLCYHYTRHNFQIEDFYPTEFMGIDEDNDYSVKPWESHLIIKNRRDGAFEEHCHNLDTNWGEGGVMQGFNYQVYNMDGTIRKPFLKPEKYGRESFEDIVNDYNRMWDFNLTTLKFDDEISSKSKSLPPCQTSALINLIL